MSDHELQDQVTRDVLPGGSASAQPSLPVYGLPMPLGKYVLVERLGVGGMAEVFLATQDGPAGFQKKHVIKRCLPHLAEDARFIEMFLREARVASRLNHPNVVAVHELGQVGNAYFLVMEFVDGMTLRRLAERAWAHKKAIPTELIVHAIGDAALGLHHAHTLAGGDGKAIGLVHRDISPENLMIDKDGNTKVLDFGIARDAATGNLTKTGELKGKIPFMSPEQIRGEALDGRADVYALGVTMYWLLTGRRPHRAPSELTLLNEILGTPAQPVGVFNPKVPKELGELCMAMLERERDLRPPTALAVYEALAQTAPTRTTVVGPFVKEVVSLPDVPGSPFSLDAAASEPATGAGFIPSTPQTSLVLTGWHRLERVGAPRTSSPAAAAPKPRRALPLFAAGVGAAALIGVTMMVAFAADDNAPPSPLPAPVVEVVQPPALEPPPPTVVEPPPAVAPRIALPAPARMQRVTLKAPARVRWLLPKGMSAAGGEVELPASLRAVKAQDEQTRGISSVPIERGVADYGRLKTGVLDVRALPWARVRIGKLDLGVTPFAPRTLVEGSYQVALEHQGKSEKRAVVLKPGHTERLVVDYRAK